MIKLLYTNNKILFAKMKYTREVFPEYKPHYHDTLSFGVIEKGTLEITFRNKKVILNSNEIVFFNKNELHCTRNINALGYFTVYIDFNWYKATLKSLNLYLDKPLKISEHIIKYKDIFQICHDLFHGKSNNEKLIKIIKEILTKYAKSENRPKLNIHVSKMKEYIKLNLNESITIDDISTDMSYNKSYLNRIFKTNIGMSPQKYILNQKINSIEKELLNTTESIVSLANNSGFYDQSHFNKNFKKIFGTTPLKYKKSI